MTTAAVASSHTSSVPALKKDRIIYWASTAVVGAVMLWSAYNFSLNAEMKNAFVHLGLPNYFRVELSIAKALGALVILIPAFPNRIKEFAYFGFVISISSATVAHISSGDGVLRGLEPLVFLALLIVSYVYYHKALDQQRLIARS